MIKFGNEFLCSLGVRQGECLSPLLFSLFLNDLEETFVTEGYNGLDIDMFKIFMCSTLMILCYLLTVLKNFK